MNTQTELEDQALAAVASGQAVTDEQFVDAIKALDRGCSEPLSPNAGVKLAFPDGRWG